MSHPAPGHQTLTSPPVSVFTSADAAATWDTENTLKTKQTLPRCCLTLFFHWNKKGTFLVLLSMSVCCLSNVLPSDCGYCFPIVDDTVSPEHKCQCYWFKLRQNSILLIQLSFLERLLCVHIIHLLIIISRQCSKFCDSTPLLFLYSFCSPMFPLQTVSKLNAF